MALAGEGPVNMLLQLIKLTKLTPIRAIYEAIRKQLLQELFPAAEGASNYWNSAKTGYNCRKTVEFALESTTKQWPKATFQLPN